MSTELSFPVDILSIRKLLPHRYPFLLVDRVVSLEPKKRIHAYKNVTGNEPFFTGHFPELPVMPGVLIIEAMAQAGGLLTMLSEPDPFHVEGPRQFFLVKVDKARFAKMVMPGDKLDLQVELKRTIRNMALYEGIAQVDGKDVASAEILCAEGRG